jgi:hypothetical protein
MIKYRLIGNDLEGIYISAFSWRGYIKPREYSA